MTASEFWSAPVPRSRPSAPLFADHDAPDTIRMPASEIALHVGVCAIDPPETRRAIGVDVELDWEEL